jgi:hypothetical protein
LRGREDKKVFGLNNKYDIRKYFVNSSYTKFATVS